MHARSIDAKTKSQQHRVYIFLEMMAVPASRRKHNVFVGNLTYNTTEEQLRDIFGTVGPVTSVRIVADKDTGRPKGYAFVEYDDPALALSAIRNLDGHDFNARKVGALG
jgi:cleavage stimulation factor subunit 2